MENIEELKIERDRLQTEMKYDIQMAKKPYMEKIFVLDGQIKRLQPGAKKSEIAKNVRKFRTR